MVVFELAETSFFAMILVHLLSRHIFLSRYCFEEVLSALVGLQRTEDKASRRVTRITITIFRRSASIVGCECGVPRNLASASTYKLINLSPQVHPHLTLTRRHYDAARLFSPACLGTFRHLGEKDARMHETWKSHQVSEILRSWYYCSERNRYQISQILSAFGTLVRFSVARPSNEVRYRSTEHIQKKKKHNTYLLTPPP